MVNIADKRAFRFDLEEIEGSIIALELTKENANEPVRISLLRIHSCFEPKRKYIAYHGLPEFIFFHMTR